MRRRCVLVPLLVGLIPILSARPGEADSPGYLQGHPWESPILEGIASQDRELRRTQAQALAGRYQRLAARPSEATESVRRYYLLGRAHGKNYEALRASAREARTPRQAAELNRQAEGAHAQSIRAYKEVLRLAPRCYFVYHDLGVLELQRPRPDHAQAIRYLNQAANLNARYPAPLRKLALIHRERQEWPQVATVLYKLIPLAPNDVVARVTLAAALTEMNRLEDARRIIDQLLDVDPDNVSFLAQKADIDFRSGRVSEAQAAFRSLAEASPANPLPLQGYLRALDWKSKNDQRVSAEEYEWVMMRMLRLETRPDVRSKLREQLQNVRKQKAEQADIGQDGKLPTPADLVKIMKGSNEEGRFRVVSFLNDVNQPPPKILLDGIMSRLSAKSEPSARVRAVAVEITGRQLGWGWMPIARLVAAQDPAPEVRLAAIDAVVRMGDQGAVARAGAVLVLGSFLDDEDRSVAAAARLGILVHGSGRLRVDENASDAQHRAAFTAWWRGPSGEDLKIESLRRYAELRDPFVEDVLARYARDDSFFVRQAAHEAFTAVREMLETPEGKAWYRGKRGAGFAAFERWMSGLPVPPGGRLTRENAGVFEPRIATWLASRPR